jgi:flagellar biogenesis protein FliO
VALSKKMHYLIINMVIVPTLFVAKVALAASTSPTANIESMPFPASQTIATPQVSAFSWGTFVTIVCIFLVLFAGFALLVKRYNRTTSAANTWFKLLDRQQLGPGHNLYLVELAGHLQILGVTNQTMVKLAELDDAELAGEILQDLAWRNEQVLPPWWSQLIASIKGGKFADELRRYDKGGN